MIRILPLLSLKEEIQKKSRNFKFFDVLYLIFIYCTLSIIHTTQFLKNISSKKHKILKRDFLYLLANLCQSSYIFKTTIFYRGGKV